jgi:hypothetical protein
VEGKRFPRLRSKFHSVNDSGAGLQEDHRVDERSIYYAQLMEQESQKAKDKVRAGGGSQPGHSLVPTAQTWDFQTQASAVSDSTLLYLIL